MKFLLTSGGITNEAIASALIDLAGKPVQEITVAFIPTAANIEEGDKSWLINDLTNLKSLGLKCIDIVDISALSREQWQPRLEAADILFFSGGNTYHLMHWLTESGLAMVLPELLKTRVYAGISAGSMVASRKVIRHAQQMYYEEKGVLDDVDGLGFVDFVFKPHLDSPWFPKVTEENLKHIATIVPETMYALDDETALKIIDGNIEVVGGGKYLIFNK